MENLIPSADGVEVLTPSVPFLGPAWLGGQPAWEVAEISSDREPGRRQGCQLTKVGDVSLGCSWQKVSHVPW